MSKWWVKLKMCFLSFPMGYDRYSILLVTWLPPFIVPLKSINDPWPYYGIESCKENMEVLKQNPSKIESIFPAMRCSK